MFDVDAFVIQGHNDYYCWLRDSTISDVERERFQRRIDQERDALDQYLEERLRGAQRAA
jgi:hypothetical protein